MTTQHTPGPWTAHDDDGTGTLPCVLSEHVNAGGNFYVAQCKVYDDARLIASAPDLLAALEAALAEHHDICEGGDGEVCDSESWCHAARAALRLAGEGQEARTA